jgi:pimeloyl-ACP methyl ester carboxylesterase
MARGYSTMIKTNIRNLIHLPGQLKTVLMLHGFPAESFTDSRFEKNLDIAQALNNDGYEVFLIHYEGLGANKDGIFSFTSSIKESITILEEISSIRNKVCLIGHSWGGFIALVLNHLFKEKIDKTILMSPLFFLPTRESLNKTMLSLCNEVPHVLKDSRTSNDLAEDLMDADSMYFKEKNDVVSKLKNITIYHPRVDDEIPLEFSQAIVELNNEVKLEICETDHTFMMNRNIFIEKIREAGL